MGNSSSNFTWNKMKCLSIELLSSTNVSNIYAAVKSIQSTKTATSWSAFKLYDSSKKTKHTWHHSIDKKRTPFHVKFELDLSISFTRKCMSKKMWGFLWVIIRPFAKWRSSKQNYFTGLSVIFYPGASLSFLYHDFIYQSIPILLYTPACTYPLCKTIEASRTNIEPSSCKVGTHETDIYLCNGSPSLMNLLTVFFPS
jgi:hypothetical protein